jgi:hypothetical protein
MIWDAMLARIGWALGEVAMIGAACLAIYILVLLVTLPSRIRRHRCKHMHYFETGKCDAICSNCGKNLGFIGSWRTKSAQ